MNKGFDLTSITILTNCLDVEGTASSFERVAVSYFLYINKNRKIINLTSLNNCTKFMLRSVDEDGKGEGEERTLQGKGNS